MGFASPPVDLQRIRNHVKEILEAPTRPIGDNAVLLAQQTDWWFAAIPTAGLGGLLALCLAAWVALHVLPLPRAWWRAWARALLRCCAAVGTVLLAAGFAQRFCVLATSWPLWVICAGGGLAVEFVLAMGRPERRSAQRRSAARVLAGLRAGLVLLLTAMLAQPVFAHTADHPLTRTVAVLVDTSSSMFQGDPQMPGGQKLRLAASLGVAQARRPVVLDAPIQKVEAAQQSFQAACEWLEALVTSNRPRATSSSTAGSPRCTPASDRTPPS